MQGSNTIARNTRCIVDSLKLEQALSLSHSSSKDNGSCHKKNISLAKQNSELKLKVAQLEEKVYNISTELFEVKFEYNSLAECNKKLEIQKERLQSIGRYGTRYFEKLGRSTEIMVEKFKKSLDLEQELSSSKFEGISTPSVPLDSSIKSERRELAAIQEEVNSLDFKHYRNEVNTPKLMSKRSRSRQLFTDNILSEEREVLKSSSKKSSSSGKRRDKIEIQVTPNAPIKCPVRINSRYLAFSAQNGVEKENEGNDGIISSRMNLRSGIRKSYIALPQNRKLRQGDNQFISIKDEKVGDNFGSDIQIYDLTE